eukprot:7389055-Prymnesium_polylepis.2
MALKIPSRGMQIGYQDGSRWRSEEGQLSLTEASVIAERLGLLMLPLAFVGQSFRFRVPRCLQRHSPTCPTYA